MHIEIAEAVIDADVRDEGRLPNELARTLRGGFGRALREISCVEAARCCDACSLATRCAYGYLFETPVPDDAKIMRKYPHAPHPLVLRAHAQDEDGGVPRLSIHVGLVGRSIAFFPHVLIALCTLGRFGLGARRAEYQVRGVTDQATGERQELAGGSAGIQGPRPVAAPIILGGPDDRALRVRLVTPLRFVSDGKLVRSLTFARLVSASLRRLELLWRLHVAEPGAEWTLDSAALVGLAESVPALSDSTHWHDTDRYSRRQGQSHPMGGLLGEITFGPEAAMFAPLLSLAGRLHVGKHTGFGHGHFVVEREEVPSV